MSGGIRRGRRSPAAALLAALTLAATIGGCDRLANSTAQRRLDARVRRSIPAIEREIGLQFKQPPRVEYRSTAQVRAFLEQAFTESRAARELAGQEQAYKLFGLVPAALDVRKILLDLLEEQVAGFYDPKTKALYVVESTAPEALGLAVAHELVHALQDQYANLDSIQNAEVDNDRATAAQAAIEGQATYVSTLNILGAAEVARLPGGWPGLAAQIRAAAAEAPGVGSAPSAIREGLIFPYAAGAAFAAAAVASHPGMRLVNEPPRSTEQVLHPARFAAATRDEPTEVRFPAPAGLRRTYENTLGEFETRLVVGEPLRDTVVAARAAAGWDGDRYLVVDAAGGAGVIWVTVWDTPTDADEFVAALRAGARRRLGVEPVEAAAADGWTTDVAFPAEQQGNAAAAARRNVLVRRGERAGRPVVLYADVPAGVAPGGVPLADVQLR